MGAQSSALSSDELFELESSTHFSSKELQSLFERFKILDRRREGMISPEDLQLIPEFSMNPISRRLIDSLLIPQENPLPITFHRFASLLSVFHTSAPLSEKNSLFYYFFHPSDEVTIPLPPIPQNAVITKEDFMEILTILTGNKMEDKERENIVDETMREISEGLPSSSSNGLSSSSVIPFGHFAVLFEKVIKEALTMKFTEEDEGEGDTTRKQ